MECPKFLRLLRLAGRVVREERRNLSQLINYMARPPIAEDRLERTATGDILETIDLFELSLICCRQLTLRGQLRFYRLNIGDSD